MTVHDLSKQRGIDPRQRVSGMIEQGVRRRRIAAEAGVTIDELNGWTAGDARSERVDQRVRAWLDELEHPDDELDPGWVELPSAAEIEGALEMARMTPGISVIYGPAGVSKTTVARRYAEGEFRGYRDNGRVFVTASEFNKTSTGILQALAEKLGQYGRAYRLNELAKMISDILPKRSVIIVDEAQHLSMAALDGLRWFMDECGIGIAYVGNEVVFTRVSGGGQRAKFAQLQSRVSHYLQVRGPTEEDVDVLLAAWRIRGREERAFALQLAAGPGSLRVLGHVLRRAKSAARELKRPVDAALLRLAADERGLID